MPCIPPQSKVPEFMPRTAVHSLAPLLSARRAHNLHLTHWSVQRFYPIARIQAPSSRATPRFVVG